MILINNPYHSPTKHNSNGKFCPMGMKNRNKLPCFFCDSSYCTYWTYNNIQEKATKE